MEGLFHRDPAWGARDYAMDWDAPAYIDQTKRDDMTSNAGYSPNDHTGLKPTQL